MRLLSSLRMPFLRSPRRVLLAETEEESSGDQALALAAVRRLQAAGCSVTRLCRTAPRENAHRINRQAKTVKFAVNDAFEGADTIETLLNQFETLYPRKYHDLLHAFEEKDLVAAAPGGRLLDGYQVARNLIVPAMALKMGIPIIILHQSVGPLEQEHHREMVRQIFLRANMTVTRDDISFAFLHELGIPNPRTFPGRDVVFGETYSAPGDIEYDLGLNIRTGFNGHAQPDVVVAFLREYVRKKPNARILVYTTSGPLSEEMTTALEPVRCRVERAPPLYPDYVTAVGRCAINVTDSFHGWIFSMMANRPAVCCQTDFESWKLQGTLVPGQEKLEVLDGFIDAPSARTVLDRVLELEKNPLPNIERQKRYLDYCRKRCDDGWQQVEDTLRSI